MMPTPDTPSKTSDMDDTLKSETSLKGHSKNLSLKAATKKGKDKSENKKKTQTKGLTKPKAQDGTNKPGGRLSWLGAVLGILGVGLGGYALLKTSTLSPPDNSEIKAEITRIESENAALKTQIARLERRLKSQNSAAAALSDINPLLARIDALEARPQSASELTQDELEGLQADITRLEKRFELISNYSENSDDKTFSSEGEAGSADPSQKGHLKALQIPLEIATRLEALEDRINKADPDTFQFGERLLRDELDAIGSRFAAMSETQILDEAPSFEAAQRRVAELLDFPETALRARLRDIELADKPWWQRSLARHISVKKSSETDEVDLIIAAIDKGEIKEAVRLIGNLPSQARSILNEWVSSAQTYLQEN